MPVTLVIAQHRYHSRITISSKGAVMDNRSPLSESIIHRELDDTTLEVTNDLAYKRIAIVNIAYVGAPGSPGWVLVDAGIMGCASAIIAAAEKRFGAGAPPAAVVLTHGHFDHVGALSSIIRRWNVPVYAHILEHPYLDGTASYPPPDPTVGGGLMSALSGVFPRSPIDITPNLRALPNDHTVPFLPDWKWVHTPGHSPGHISLWRDVDRVLIAGDAFVTTKQESVYAVITQAPELNGPPKYYTQDWEEAEMSVKKLDELQPEIVIPGHGRAMEGGAMRQALDELANNFSFRALPEHGYYLERPARPYHDIRR